MLQDIGPEKLINHYEDLEIRDNDFLMIFQDNKIFIKNTDDKDQAGFLRLADYKRILTAEHSGQQVNAAGSFHYLFSIGADRFFCLETDEEIQIPEREGSFIRLFQLRRMKPLRQVLAGATAFHLYQWYRSNRYCGACGARTLHDRKERMMRCPKCGNLIFPKIAPAVIVGVRHGSRLLMTKYANREYKRYALIAGFTEIGETLEETVMREVMEETGIRVKNITYYKSQPWGFDSNILAGFYCDLDGSDQITMDADELALAEWVEAKDIPESSEGISLTEEMMMKFKRDHI